MSVTGNKHYYEELGKKLNGISLNGLKKKEKLDLYESKTNAKIPSLWNGIQKLEKKNEGEIKQKRKGSLGIEKLYKKIIARD